MNFGYILTVMFGENGYIPKNVKAYVPPAAGPAAAANVTIPVSKAYISIEVVKLAIYTDIYKFYSTIKYF